MKNLMKISVLVLAFSSIGCNTLKRLTHSESQPPENHSLGDDYTLTGTTTVDLQVIQPVRCLDSEITVRVKVPGSTEFRTLNKYEFKADSVGVGGGGVWLRHQVIIIGTTLQLTGKPVAPVGTQYEIRSVLKVTEHNLY